MVNDRMLSVTAHKRVTTRWKIPKLKLSIERGETTAHHSILWCRNLITGLPIDYLQEFQYGNGIV